VDPSAPYRYAKLTWPEVNDAVRRDLVILVPVGAIEQHGPHLPIDTDNVAIETICEQAARASDVILLAPPIHYGFNEHNMDFPGTINIDPEHFTHYATDVGLSFAHQGFRNIIFANGHGSNAILLELAARLVTVRAGVRCASLSWWSMVAAEAMAMRESPFPGGMSHACEAETSVYLHVDPALVDMTKARRDIWESGSKYVWHDLIQGSPVRFVDFHSKRSIEGTTGDPTLATPEKGERLVSLAASRIAEFASELRTLDWGTRRDHRVAPDAVGQSDTGGLGR
jgi:creatinine amidohydrolase